MTFTVTYSRALQCAFVAITLSSAAMAQAQLSDLVDVIQRNEELLREAVVLVRQTNSSKARASLEASVKLHQFSKELFAAGDAERAARVTLQARQAILNTINIARREVRLEQTAIRTMERAALRLQQARTLYEEYGQGNDVPVRKLIEEAYNQLQRARDNIREHLFDIARQLARASLDMSNRAIRLLKRDTFSPEDVFREIERTDNIIDRILSRDEPALRRSIERAMQQAMEQAVDLQNRAKHNARSDNYPLALEQTHRARGIATRAARGAVATVEPDRESVARAIAFTDELFERARDIARANGLPRLVENLEEAARLQSAAKDKFAAEQYRAAMTLTLRARDIARRALRVPERPLDEQSVGAALDRTDETIERLSSRVSDGDTTARALLERARDRQASARTAYESDELRRALALTRVARELARHALQELGADEAR
ncbi:MAG: hypothetical protein IH969_03125 [Candidatus Krumholzibacteriota bacterium]|nr:hypothetical protein [Candidatus Krumholzibacteriota bacterium]